MNAFDSKVKTARQLERLFKGVAIHRRIAILVLVAKNPGMSLEQIADDLRCNIKTISEHTRRLVHAGLLNKKYKGRTVEHSISPYGKIFYEFIRTF